MGTYEFITIVLIIFIPVFGFSFKQFTRPEQTFFHKAKWFTFMAVSFLGVVWCSIIGIKEYASSTSGKDNLPSQIVEAFDVQPDKTSNQGNSSSDSSGITSITKVIPASEHSLFTWDQSCPGIGFLSKEFDIEGDNLYVKLYRKKEGESKYKKINSDIYAVNSLKQYTTENKYGIDFSRFFKQTGDYYFIVSCSSEKIDDKDFLKQAAKQSADIFRYILPAKQLSKPTDLHISKKLGFGGLELNWNRVTSADGYFIWIKGVTEDTQSIEIPCQKTSIDAENLKKYLKSNCLYQVRIMAWSDNILDVAPSNYSNPIIITSNLRDCSTVSDSLGTKLTLLESGQPLRWDNDHIGHILVPESLIPSEGTIYLELYKKDSETEYSHVTWMGSSANYYEKAEDAGYLTIDLSSRMFDSGDYYYTIFYDWDKAKHFTETLSDPPYQSQGLHYVRPVQTLETPAGITLKTKLIGSDRFFEWDKVKHSLYYRIIVSENIQDGSAWWLISEDNKLTYDELEKFLSSGQSYTFTVQAISEDLTQYANSTLSEPSAAFSIDTFAKE